MAIYQGIPAMLVKTGDKIVIKYETVVTPLRQMLINFKNAGFMSYSSKYDFTASPIAQYYTYTVTTTNPLKLNFINTQLDTLRSTKVVERVKVDTSKNVYILDASDPNLQTILDTVLVNGDRTNIVVAVKSKGTMYNLFTYLALQRITPLVKTHKLGAWGGRYQDYTIVLPTKARITVKHRNWRIGLTSRGRHNINIIDDVLATGRNINASELVGKAPKVRISPELQARKKQAEQAKLLKEYAAKQSAERAPIEKSAWNTLAGKLGNEFHNPGKVGFSVIIKWKTGTTQAQKDASTIKQGMVDIGYKVMGNDRFIGITTKSAIPTLGKWLKGRNTQILEANASGYNKYKYVSTKPYIQSAELARRKERAKIAAGYADSFSAKIGLKPLKGYAIGNTWNIPNSAPLAYRTKFEVMVVHGLATKRPKGSSVIYTMTSRSSKYPELIQAILNGNIGPDTQITFAPPTMVKRGLVAPTPSPVRKEKEAPKPKPIVKSKVQQAKKIIGKSRATVAYILDPDLAISDSLYLPVANKLGLKNKGSSSLMKGKKGKVKARGKARKERQAALDLVIDEVSPFLDLLKYGNVASDKEAIKRHVDVLKELSQSDYSRLNKFGKQFYVKADSAFYDRYAVGGNYAGLPIPPTGRFTKLSPALTENQKVTVRGQTSTTKKGTRHMLVRLTDGSLLEFYTSDPNISTGEVESVINTIAGQEPTTVKKFIISPSLTVDLGRPAYDIGILINTIKSIESMSTTPSQDITTIQVGATGPVQYFEQSPNTVLVMDKDFPASLFYEATVKNKAATMKYYNQLITKYKADAVKSVNNRTVWNAMNQLVRKPIFDNIDFGGSANELLHPVVVEFIFDEFIAGKSRSDNLKTGVIKMGATDTAFSGCPPESSFGGLASKLRQAIEKLKQEGLAKKLGEEMERARVKAAAEMGRTVKTIEKGREELTKVSAKAGVIVGKDMIRKAVPDTFGTITAIVEMTAKEKTLLEHARKISLTEAQAQKTFQVLKSKL